MEKKPIHNNLSLMFYHLDPYWCSHKEFDAMLEKGYVNALRLTMDNYDTARYGCKKALAMGYPVWLVPPIYLPTQEPITAYIKKFEGFVNRLKADEVWDAVVGFQWDEPLLKRGHTNEALLEMTKAVSETFGKRIFTNFSLYEIAGKRGNDGDPDFQWLLRKDCSKYITDTGFDLYGWDFRKEAQERLLPSLQKRGAQHGVEINTTEELYQFYTDTTLSLIENADKVRFWYYPCAYNCNVGGGKRADEDYCTAHLEGFKNLLLKQKNPGGIVPYTYKNSVDVFIHPDNPERWIKYDAALKNVCAELNAIKTK